MEPRTEKILWALGAVAIIFIETAVFISIQSRGAGYSFNYQTGVMTHIPARFILSIPLALGFIGVVIGTLTIFTSAALSVGADYIDFTCLNCGWALARSDESICPKCGLNLSSQKLKWAKDA